MNAVNLTLEQYEQVEPITTVKFRGQTLKYWTPNRVTAVRAQSLFGPGMPMFERETIRWINTMSDNDVLVDIGANVGMYSTLAAKNGAKVLAVEPEASNYQALCKNIELNRVGNTIVALCAGISDVTKPDRFFIGNPGIGQSCHSLGVAETPEGDLFDPESRPAQTVMSYRLDDLLEIIENRQPTHIKIDVDGIEHRVVDGMRKTLASPSVKSVLIELNPQNQNHSSVFDIMGDMGYLISDEQIKACTIKEGSWAGTCNVIFFRPEETAVHSMFPPSASPEQATLPVLDISAAQDICEKIKSVEIVAEPTPHFLIDNVFSDADYEMILRNLPPASLYCDMDEMGWTSGAKNRTVFDSRDDFLAMLPEKQDTFLRSLLAVTQNHELISTAATRFARWIPELAENTQADGFSVEACFTKDFEGYEIGPHSDAVDRVLSLLFYLPRSEAAIDSGTSLYVPKDKGFVCRGGPWHSFEDFREVSRIPYKPNTLFGFVKTATSFHGVTPLPSVSIDRDILHVTLHLNARQG